MLQTQMNQLVEDMRRPSLRDAGRGQPTGVQHALSRDEDPGNGGTRLTDEFRQLIRKVSASLFRNPTGQHGAQLKPPVEEAFQLNRIAGRAFAVSLTRSLLLRGQTTTARVRQRGR